MQLVEVLLHVLYTCYKLCCQIWCWTILLFLYSTRRYCEKCGKRTWLKQHLLCSFMYTSVVNTCTPISFGQTIKMTFSSYWPLEVWVFCTDEITFLSQSSYTVPCSKMPELNSLNISLKVALKQREGLLVQFQWVLFEMYMFHYI